MRKLYKIVNTINKTLRPIAFITILCIIIYLYLIIPIFYTNKEINYIKDLYNVETIKYFLYYLYLYTFARSIEKYFNITHK